MGHVSIKKNISEVLDVKRKDPVVMAIVHVLCVRYSHEVSVVGQSNLSYV